MSTERETAELYARLDDLLDCALSGELGLSGFLTPRDAHYASAYLRRKGVHFLSLGGYSGAERVRIAILPDYMEPNMSADGLADYGYTDTVAAVRISAGGYRKLSHRDYMGSVLGLGVERSVVGDILVLGESGETAYIFCDAAMVRFFEEELTKVANDKVRTEAVALSEVRIPERRFAAVSDTVASARLDCVVAALCNFAREKAKEAVLAGLVEVDYECEERPDRTLTAPCLVTVRGHGKYRVLSVSDVTRKGRYRLSAEKYL